MASRPIVVSIVVLLAPLHGLQASDPPRPADLVRGGREPDAVKLCATMRLFDGPRKVSTGQHVDDLLGCGTAIEHSGDLDGAAKLYREAQRFAAEDPYVLASIYDTARTRAKQLESGPRRGGPAAFCWWMEAKRNAEELLRIHAAAASENPPRVAGMSIFAARPEMIEEMKKARITIARRLLEIKKATIAKPEAAEIEGWMKHNGPFRCVGNGMAKDIDASPYALLIPFAHDSAKFKGDDQVKPLAAALLANVDVKIRLVGYASLPGSPDYNKRLSLRRADAVKKALVKLDRSLASRVVTEGRGSANPVFIPGEDGKEDEEMSRRVELERYHPAVSARGE